MSHLKQATATRERPDAPEPGHRVVRRGAFAPDAMSPALDALTLKFAIAARNAQGVSLDVGCGDGIATAAALARGAHVIAVDRNPLALFQLHARIPIEQHARLRACVGTLPELDFMRSGFEAVHIARVMHRLSGEEIRQSLRKVFRWIFPQGRLYLSVLAPAGSFWQSFQREYQRRVARGLPWPGYIEDVSRFVADCDGNEGPIHLIDERVLRRELEAAEFVIDEMSTYPLPWDPAQVCCGVVARCAE